MNNPLSRVHLSHATFFSSVPPPPYCRDREKSGIKILGVAGGVGHRKEREKGARSAQRQCSTKMYPKLITLMMISYQNFPVFSFRCYRVHANIDKLAKPLLSSLHTRTVDVCRHTGFLLSPSPSGGDCPHLENPHMHRRRIGSASSLSGPVSGGRRRSGCPAVVS